MFSGIKGGIVMVSAYKLHHSVVFCIHRTLCIAGIYCNYLLEVNNTLSYVCRDISGFCFSIFPLPIALVFVYVFILVSSDNQFQTFVFHSSSSSCRQEDISLLKKNWKIHHMRITWNGYLWGLCCIFSIENKTVNDKVMPSDVRVDVFCSQKSSLLIACVGSKGRTPTSVYSTFLLCGG